MKHYEYITDILIIGGTLSLVGLFMYGVFTLFYTFFKGGCLL